MFLWSQQQLQKYHLESPKFLVLLVVKFNAEIQFTYSKGTLYKSALNPPHIR